MTGHRLVVILSFAFGMLCGAVAYGYYAHQPSTDTHKLEVADMKSSPLGKIDTSAPSHTTNANILENKMMLADQIMVNTQRWHSHEEELRSLRERLTLLETTIESAQGLASSNEDSNEWVEESNSELMSETTLIAAGVREDVAANIVRRLSTMEMQRLELRDRATRENWIGTDRYAEALRELNEDEVALRDDIDDDTYDRLLYSTGQSNRIVISSVIQDSPAAQAGILSGDVVLSYAGERVFSWSDLSKATTQGQREDYVSVLLERDDEMVELSLPRGPLGVKLDTTRRDPAGDKIRNQD